MYGLSGSGFVDYVPVTIEIASTVEEQSLLKATRDCSLSPSSPLYRLALDFLVPAIRRKSSVATENCEWPVPRWVLQLDDMDDNQHQVIIGDEPMKIIP